MKSFLYLLICMSVVLSACGSAAVATPTATPTATATVVEPTPTLKTRPQRLRLQPTL